MENDDKDILQDGDTLLDEHIGNRLRQARAALNLTQTDLGKMVGITYQQMQKYERAVNRISAGKLYECALALNVPLQYFYEGAPVGSIMAGFAEQDQELPIGFPNLPENTGKQEMRELLYYYFRIGSAEKRQRVLELIRVMSDEDEKEKT